MIQPSYDLWRKRLAAVQSGLANPKQWPRELHASIEPGPEDCGFWRLPIKTRQENGRWKLERTVPVALFVADGRLICHIGHEEVDEDRRNDAWSWFLACPITEEEYRAELSQIMEAP